MFICPKCKRKLQGFYPGKCVCGYEVPCIDSIYEFCDDPPISIEKEGYKYLGYEYVGENFNGPLEFKANHISEFNESFKSCSKVLIDKLGKDCVILDLGAGMGPASISLAMYGAKTIAADISRKMLSIAVNYAHEMGVTENLIFARMNGYNLLLENNCVDAVICIDMLHQVDNPEAVVNEILRVLKPGGILVEYGKSQLPLTESQNAVKIKCSEALSDIGRFYVGALSEYGYEGYPFSSWDKVRECMNLYFEEPEIILSETEIIWTGAMKKGIHKLKTRAAGFSQLIPDEIHNNAWCKTDEYARKKIRRQLYKLTGICQVCGITSNIQD